ncbi:MAG TPA: NAD-dependent epimerase/dehydratase family protein [Verrucomicrobiae bacterium]|nr:NAD-dependent epimerase/dehydratase family protein [Verrucomicrobiae bacterium]
MKILVTGGAGFIGSHIVEHFQNNGEVRVLDNLRSGFRENLAGLKHELIEASILDRAAVRQAVQGVDYIFHLAATTSVPESLAKPAECEDININGTRVVLEEAAKAGVKKMVFSSTAAIYGDNPVVPKVESMPPEPKTPYATTKLEGERLCREFVESGKLQTVCLRYFNVFGPRQDPGSEYAAVIPVFLRRALNHDPITIYGDGKQTRDFIFVQAVAAANAHFATLPTVNGVFNVAGGVRMTINDLAATICDQTGSRSRLRHVPERAGDVKHSMASIKRLESTGFVPRGSLAEGLKATAEFYSEKVVAT